LIGLLTLVFLPITGDLISVYQDQPLAVAMFAGNMALIGLANAAIWFVAARRGLLIDEATRKDIHDGHWFGGLSTGVFALSLPVCWISIRAAKLMWLGVVLFIFVQRRANDRRNPQLVD
jgi:uncharacterized membrane protein